MYKANCVVKTFFFLKFELQKKQQLNRTKVLNNIMLVPKWYATVTYYLFSSFSLLEYVTENFTFTNYIRYNNFICKTQKSKHTCIHDK